MTMAALAGERESDVARPAVRVMRNRARYPIHLPPRIEDYIPDDQWAIFQPALQAVRALQLPFAIGGGMAVSLYSGHWRNSKDIDLYVVPEHREQVIEAVLGTGLSDYFDVVPYDRAWIFRAARDGVIVDVMWALANGAGDVEPGWLTRGGTAEVRGETLRLLAPEEMFWSKVHVMQRDRCDWPDLLNLLYCAGPHFDWARLLQRMASHERLLASILSLFAWIAPGRAQLLPEWLWRQLRLDPPTPGPARRTENIRLLDVRDWFTPIEPTR
jgi:hypothetical protein